MTTIERNQPCPCGSGKKYKACCLDRDAAMRRGEDQVPLESDEAFKVKVLEGVADFVASVYKKVADQGRDLYLRLDDYGEESEDAFPLDESELDEWSFRMMMGVMFDLPTREGGEVVAEAYLRKRGGRLSPEERTWLERLIEAPLTPYEIVEPPTTASLHVIDLGSGEARLIHEPELSLDLEHGDIIAARLTHDGEKHVMETGWYLFRPEWKPALEAEMAKFVKKQDALSWTALDKAQRRLFSIILHALWNQLVLEADEEETRSL